MTASTVRHLRACAFAVLTRRCSGNVSPEMGRLIVESLVSSGRAEWDNKERTRFLVVWRTTDEWADLVYRWAQEVGYVNNVLTVYELLHGDETSEQPFYGIEYDVMRKALATLEKKDKAVVFGGAEQNEEGVKFL